MTKKADLLAEEGLSRVRGRLQSYICQCLPQAHFRWIYSDNTDDIDVAVDTGLGERFVRISFETALEVPNLAAHLEANVFISAFQMLTPEEQLVVATTGLRVQPLAGAFR